MGLISTDFAVLAVFKDNWNQIARLINLYLIYLI